MRLPEYRKLLVFVLTVVGNALNLGLVPEPAKVWVFLVISTAGAYGVYRLPNEDARLT